MDLYGCIVWIYTDWYKSLAKKHGDLKEYEWDSHGIHDQLQSPVGLYLHIGGWSSIHLHKDSYNHYGDSHYEMDDHKPDTVV